MFMIQSTFPSPNLPLTYIWNHFPDSKNKHPFTLITIPHTKRPEMLALQSRAIDQCTKAVKADKAGEDRLALYYYKESLRLLMEWLTLEKENGAREALKKRIRGYMARAEELKDVLTAAAQRHHEESGASATTMTNITDKGTRAGGKSKNSNNTIIDAGENSNSGCSCGSNRTFPATATTIIGTEVGPQQDGNTAPIQVVEGEKEHDTDIIHYRMGCTPVVPLPDSDAIHSSINALCEEELREREAWLREWEAALVAKDLELQWRVKEVSTMEKRVEAQKREIQGEDERKKESTKKKMGGVEGGEAAVGGKPGKDRVRNEEKALIPSNKRDKEETQRERRK